MTEVEDCSTALIKLKGSPGCSSTRTIEMALLESFIETVQTVETRVQVELIEMILLDSERRLLLVEITCVINEPVYESVLTLPVSPPSV